MKVIGTAGHIDHGKSALVRRLTGTDPDRLPEEKRRGMTIDLGFAVLTLPNGERASVVDVPGHERFVRTMLAGASGIDIALVAIAADEGVMPQTSEHIAILDLLGVEHAVVALTKCDLVDQEWLSLVNEEVHQALEGTTLRGSPVVPVSVITDEGLDLLLAILQDVARSAPPGSKSVNPWLPVDRVFTMEGFGTVVTGTLHGGDLRTGADVEIVPGGHRSRIRAMERHDEKIERACAGDRIALNLTGIERTAVRRGDVVALPETVRAVRHFDARLRVLPAPGVTVRQGMEVSICIGAAQRTANVSVLEGSEIKAGEECWARIRMAEPCAAMPGQRFIVRLPAPAGTVGGGTVVEVAPRQRRNEMPATTRLERLHFGSERDAVLTMLRGPHPRLIEQIATALGRTAGDIAEIVRELVATRDAIDLGGWILSWDDWLTVSSELRDELRNYHGLFPLRRGMPREEMRSKLGWRPKPWTEMVDRLVRDSVVWAEGATIALADFAPAPGNEEARASVLETLAIERFSPPPASVLLMSPGVSRELLESMSRVALIVRLDADLYISSAAYQEMVDWVVGQATERGAVTVAELRDRFATSRRYALALLEHLDGRQITRRAGDVRVLGSKARACV